MSDLSHSTNHNRFSENRGYFHSFPAIWPIGQLRQVHRIDFPQILTENDPLPPSRRLVVILPDADFDILSLPKRIWDLAAPNRRQVLLMSKPCREENEFQVRMNLATLAAIIRDPQVEVETQLVLGIPLDQAAYQCNQPDDIFVCFEEHCVSGFLKKKRLADLLAQKTELPVYTLKGSISEIVDPKSFRLLDFVLLMVGMAALFGFFALQVWIDQSIPGMLRIILQILTVFAEIWIIAACANKAFRF